jgi:deoxycytidine triphosphate deaminase
MSLIHPLRGSSQSEIMSEVGINAGQIQPNAIDLRLARIFKIEPTPFIITEDERVHRRTTEIRPDEDGNLVLDHGKYDVLFEEHVRIAEGEAGWLIARSSLNRNAVFITSGLYDSGFDGQIGGVMHVGLGGMITRPYTRLAQLIIAKAETAALYAGSYGIQADGSLSVVDAARYGIN